MRVHAIQTGMVAIKQRQVRGVGQGIQRRVNTVLDRAWLAPMLIPFRPAAVGTFPTNYPLTRAEDVVLVPTGGHTAGHLSLIVLEDDHALFLAGDTSYSQPLMLDEVVDGVAPDEHVSRQTLRRIHAFTQQVPTVYLSSHDPQARERLFHRQTVLFPETSKAAL